MTIAAFNQFMTAIDREIERKRIDAMPDYVPSATGKSMIPNYDKPGVAEAVARRAFDDQQDANPPRSSIDLLMFMIDRVRFEKSIQGEK